jgi:hypothetical protein
MKCTVKSILVNICLIIVPPKKWSKTGHALTRMFLNIALEYAIRMVQENQVGQKLNETHQLLAYAHDVNLLGDNIDTINPN